MTPHGESLADLTVLFTERAIGPAPAREARRVPSALDEHNWMDDPEEVFALAEWLEEQGEMPPLPDGWRTFFEKPWHYEAERRRYVRSLLPEGHAR